MRGISAIIGFVVIVVIAVVYLTIRDKVQEYERRKMRDRYLDQMYEDMAELRRRQELWDMNNPDQELSDQDKEWIAQHMRFLQQNRFAQEMNQQNRFAGQQAQQNWMMQEMLRQQQEWEMQEMQRQQQEWAMQEMQRQQQEWAMQESMKAVTPFEMGGYDMTQGNSFNQFGQF